MPLPDIRNVAHFSSSVVKPRLMTNAKILIKPSMCGPVVSERAYLPRKYLTSARTPRTKPAAMSSQISHMPPIIQPIPPMFPMPIIGMPFRLSGATGQWRQVHGEGLRGKCETLDHRQIRNQLVHCHLVEHDEHRRLDQYTRLGCTRLHTN